MSLLFVHLLTLVAAPRREQDYENFLSMKDYSNAIMLALSMDQPRRLLLLFTEVRASAGTNGAEDLLSLTGSRHVDAVLRGLSPAELRQLFRYIKDWNTVSRTADTAQSVLHAILKFHDADALLAVLENRADEASGELDLTNGKSAAAKDADEDDDEDDDEAKKRKKRTEVKASEILGALIPYTERHMTRADKLVRESFIVEHLLGMMEGFDDFDVAGEDEAASANGMDVDEDEA